MEEWLDSSQATLKPILAKKRIIVRSPINEGNQNVSVSMEKNIKTLWFVRQGPCKIDVTLEKSAVGANTEAVVICALDNSRCDKDIKEIKVKLRRIMTITGTSDNKSYEDSVILLT